MIQKSFHNNHFNSIQLLRGIASIFVVLEHIRFINRGAFGVDIFFIISGFMIMFTTHKSTKNFLTKRLIRILPLYYLMTIGTFFLLLFFPFMFEQTKADFSYLVKSLLFIPFDIGNGIIQPLMRIGWTVNYEMFFYLLFFLCLHISHKYRGILCSMVLIFLVLWGQLFPVDSAFLTFYREPIILEFVLGILCYYLCQKLYNLYQKKNFSFSLFSVCIIISILIFGILFITKPYTPIDNFGRFFYWGIPAMILVLCFFMLGLYLNNKILDADVQPQNKKNRCRSDLNHKVLDAGVQLGNMSFSLYLMHYYPVMFLDRVLFDFSVCSVKAVIGTVISLCICMVLSYLCWYVIEKKFTGWLRKTLKI